MASEVQMVNNNGQIENMDKDTLEINKGVVIDVGTEQNHTVEDVAILPIVETETQQQRKISSEQCNLEESTGDNTSKCVDSEVQILGVIPNIDLTVVDTNS